jgi:hypothetical protein
VSRAHAAAALAALTVAAAQAGPYRDSNGHFHQSILVFAPLGAECTATRDGTAIFHQTFQERAAGSDLPSIDADVAASHDDITLACSVAGQPTITKILKWGVQIAPFDIGPGPCPGIHDIDEPKPDNCQGGAIYAYPRYVRMDDE